MELFKSGKSQLDTIKKWIDDSDIFMIILGARYGSIDEESGKSYTQLEYEHAMASKKPIISLVLGDDGKEERVKKHGSAILEQNDTVKYNQFKKQITSKICSFYSTLEDLKYRIVAELSAIDKQNNLVGWIRADYYLIQTTPSTPTSSISNDATIENNTPFQRINRFFETNNADGFPVTSATWSSFTTSNPVSFGAPSEWSNFPSIGIDEMSFVDGLRVFTGIRYMYCPRIEQGIRIVTENGIFIIEKQWNG